MTGTSQATKIHVKEKDTENSLRESTTNESLTLLVNPRGQSECHAANMGRPFFPCYMTHKLLKFYLIYKKVFDKYRILSYNYFKIDYLQKRQSRRKAVTQNYGSKAERP
jgi:hypothetical protein